MTLNKAIKIFKNLYSDEYDDEEIMEAITLVARYSDKVYDRVTKRDLLYAFEYVLDILGK